LQPTFLDLTVDNVITREHQNRPVARTNIKSLMYEDWYSIDMPAAAKGADSSCTRAPELSEMRSEYLRPEECRETYRTVQNENLSEVHSIFRTILLQVLHSQWDWICDPNPNRTLDDAAVGHV
jgi:hypothetical protein